MIELDKFIVNGLNNVYAVGMNDKLVTIHNQQLRAVTLAHLLSDSVPNGNRSKICLIGGGIAGLTLSLELLKLGWTDITILERLPDLLGIQNGCDTRWVHPNIIEWPEDGCQIDKSAIGTLDWTASTAANVTYEIESKWMREVREKTRSNTKGRPERQLSVHVGVTYVHADASGERVKVEWIRDARVRPIGFKGSRISNGDCRDYQCLVLTTGFGIEQASRLSYWRNEDYGQVHLDGVQKAYIVSGLGDGAVSDLLRLTIRNFRLDRLTEDGTPLTALKGELLPFKGPSASDKYDLFGELEAIAGKRKTIGAKWKRLLKYLVEHKREDTKVLLHHHSILGFVAAFNSSKACFLNRVLLFALYRCGAFQFVDGNYSKDLAGVAVKFDVPVERVILRHGENRMKNVAAIFGKADGIISVQEQPSEQCLQFVASKRKAGQSK